MIQFEEGERIHLIKRRHPFILKMRIYPFLFILSITATLIFLFLFFFRPTWPEVFIKFYPQIESYNLRFFLLFFFSVFHLLFWNLLWFAILDYYLNCFIVTNKRVIQIEMKGIFNLSYSSIFHDKIQDIIISVKGFLPAFFHYGDIQIETAGGFKQFIFTQIADPEIVKQVILEAKRDFLIQTWQK